MVLTPELIDAVKKEVGIQQYFQSAEVATPKHILFKQFIENTKWKGLPKIIFYILMDDLYPQAKADDGNLGYLVLLILPTSEQAKQYPQGGYAPGDYHNRCSTCERSFFGDKRAWQCEPCGTKSQAEFDALSDEQKLERQKQNAELFNQFMEERKQKDNE